MGAQGLLWQIPVLLSPWRAWGRLCLGWGGRGDVCRYSVPNPAEQKLLEEKRIWSRLTLRRSLVGCSPWGHQESDTTGRLPFHFSLSCVGEGNGNPLQCSCLENPRDGGAWWAAVYGVAQSRTRLKRLSSSSSTLPQPDKCSFPLYSSLCCVYTWTYVRTYSMQ